MAYFDQLRATRLTGRHAGRLHQPRQRGGSKSTDSANICAATGRLSFAARAFARAVTLGGERNCLLLARLFARPATVRVLDEPTNDLDVKPSTCWKNCCRIHPGTVFPRQPDRTFLGQRGHPAPLPT